MDITYVLFLFANEVMKTKQRPTLGLDETIKSCSIFIEMLAVSWFENKQLKTRQFLEKGLQIFPKWTYAWFFTKTEK